MIRRSRKATEASSICCRIAAVTGTNDANPLWIDDALLRHGVSQAEMAFLQKPFTPAGLAVKVREALGAARVRFHQE